MVGNLSPPFFEGVSGDTVFVRSIGDWHTWGGSRAEIDVPLAQQRVAGDILFVWEAGNASSITVNSNWERIDITSGIATALWTRKATGDSNDSFTMDEIVSDTQEAGGAQMVAIAGLDWDARAEPHETGEVVARSKDCIYDGVDNGTEDNTLIIITMYKQWVDSTTYPIPPDFAPLYFDTYTDLSLFSGQRSIIGGGDRDSYLAWGWRYDEGSPVTLSAGSLNQVPLDQDQSPGFPRAGSVYSMSNRCISEP